MTSEAPNLHVSKNLNISETKQDIEKLRTRLRLVWKCSDAFKIGSSIFRRRGTLITYAFMFEIYFYGLVYIITQKPNHVYSMIFRVFH